MQVKPEGTPVPKWLQKFTRSVLLICCSGCKKTENQVKSVKPNNEAAKQINLKAAMKKNLKRQSAWSGEKSDNPNAEQATSIEEIDDVDEDNDVFEYECKDVADMIDAFFFVVFAVFNIINTLVFMTVLSVGGTLSHS